MDASIVVTLLGTQFLTGEVPVSLPDARKEVTAAIKKHVTDSALVSEALRATVRLKHQGTLTKDGLDLIIQNIVSKHFLAEDCSYRPLIEGIQNSQPGQDGHVSVPHSLRIFPIIHEDYQDDGWSCLYRSIFSAAALQKHIDGGDTVLSSKHIGQYSRELRALPGFSGCIDYLTLRDTLSAACSLLPQEQDRIERSVGILQEQHPSLLKMFHALWPDYFIQRQALAFLKKDPPDIFYAVALLGKASDASLKMMSEELVRSLLDEYKRNNGSFDTLDHKITQLCQAFQNDIADLKRLKDQWNSVINKDESRIKIVLLSLGGGHVGTRKSLFQLSKGVPVIAQALGDLIQECKKIDLMQGDTFYINSCSSQLEGLMKQRVTVILDTVCSQDASFRSLVRCIDQCICPHLTSALVLFHSKDVENDDIIDLLKKSSQGRDLQNLEAHHACLSTSIRSLEEQLGIYKPDTLAEVLRVLQSDPNQSDQIKAVIAILNQAAPPQEDGIKQARMLLRDADTQSIREALKVFEPQLPDIAAAEPTEDVLSALKKDLEGLQNLELKEFKKELEAASTLQEAHEVVRKFGQAANTSVEDTLALLKLSQGLQVPNGFLRTKELMNTLRTNVPRLGEPASFDRGTQLINMPALNLSKEHVHILGDFVGRGRLTVLSEGTTISRGPHESEEQYSNRLIEIIRDCFIDSYLRTNTTGMYHFICNIKRPAAHWVCVSLVKIKDKKPILVVLDPKNYPIVSTSNTSTVGTDTIISFLYNRFIRHFDQVAI